MGKKTKAEALKVSRVQAAKASQYMMAFIRLQKQLNKERNDEQQN